METLSKYFGLIIILSFMITGCSNVTITEKDELLFSKLDELQNFIEEDQWDKALNSINEFQVNYEHRKWKMQFLGKLEDYEEIELEIQKLKATIDDKDELECKVGLRQIKHRMFIIYNL